MMAQRRRFSAQRSRLNTRKTDRQTDRQTQIDKARQTDTKKHPETHLEQLVERAEASRGDDERLAVVEHPELSGEEVVELER